MKWHIEGLHPILLEAHMAAWRLERCVSRQVKSAAEKFDKKGSHSDYGGNAAEEMRLAFDY